MPVVHLVRHGQASFDRATDADGPAYDVLSETGWRQAALVGTALAARCPKPTVLVSGTLRRQSDTAVIAARTAGWDATARHDPRWNEYDHLGVLRRHGPDGAVPDSADTFQAALDAALRAWIDADATTTDDATDTGDATPAAGATIGETWSGFTARVRSGLTDLLDDLGSGDTAVVFTSVGVVAAVGAALLGLGTDGYVALNRVQVNASVTTVVHGRSGTSLLTFNDHAHLLGAAARTYR